MSSVYDTLIMQPEKVFLFNDSKTFLMGAFMDGDLCDRIIQYYEESNLKYKDYVVDRIKGLSFDDSIRDNYSCPLSGQLSEEYTNSLIRIFHLYYSMFPMAQTGNKSGINFPVKIQKYTPPDGGYHAPHCERTHENLNRHLVFMTYLNDVTDGGETEFEYQNVKVKPQKGLTLIWPPDWTYTHRGLKSPTQEKYIATGWLVITPQSEWTE